MVLSYVFPKQYSIAVNSIYILSNLKMITWEDMCEHVYTMLFCIKDLSSMDIGVLESFCSESPLDAEG